MDFTNFYGQRFLVTPAPGGLVVEGKFLAPTQHHHFLDGQIHTAVLPGGRTCRYIVAGSVWRSPRTKELLDEEVLSHRRSPGVLYCLDDCIEIPTFTSVVEYHWRREHNHISHRVSRCVLREEPFVFKGLEHAFRSVSNRCGAGYASDIKTGIVSGSILRWGNIVIYDTVAEFYDSMDMHPGYAPLSSLRTRRAELNESIIAAVYHPDRMERMMEAHGEEYMDILDGPDDE
jgi:hypothetical protein